MKIERKYMAHFLNAIKPGVGMWDMMKRMTPETMAKMINMPDGFIESLNAQLIKIKK